jgi:Uma2 family endonuclease
MSTIFLYDESVHIPSWVTDHAAFRRWHHSDEFPEYGRICFLNGEVYVDLSMEQIYSHVGVKTEICLVLAAIAKREQLGEYYGDGLMVSHGEAELSSKPDGTFVSNKAFRDGSVQLVEGREQGYVELEGSPDMVLEVVSDSSEEKDCELLRESYWKAGIREYWLVDARNDVNFQILRHTDRGYSSVRKSGGWLKSAVFGRSFRLIRTTNHLGHPEFTLEVR